MAGMSVAAGPASTSAILRSFPRPVWILFLGTFLNKFGTFVIPFLAIYLTRRGYSLTDAGLAIGAYGIGQLVASAFGGHLADTLGRRKTIVLSMFSAATSMLLLGHATGFGAIVALTCLAGLTGELYRPASSALLADLVPEGHRLVAFSAYRLAFNAGWAFGPAAAGFLADHGFIWLFVGDAITSALFGLVAWFQLPVGLQARPENTGWTIAWKALRQDRDFRQLLLAGFLISLVFLQMGSTYGLQVTSLGFSEKTYGLLLSLNGVLVVCFELPLTSITRRFSPRYVMALGYCLVAAGFASNTVTSSVPGLVAGLVTFTVGEMLLVPMANASIADLAPPHLRGRYMGIWGLTSSLALIVGPPAGMFLFRHRPDLLWMSCGCIGIAAAGVILAGARRSAPTPEHRKPSPVQR